MNILTPPQIDSTDLYEQSKFKLLWNFIIALIVLLTLVTISNFSNPNYSSIPNIIAVGIAIIALIFLKITKQYKAVAIFVVLSCFLLISFTYFTLQVLHYTTPLWMILNILLTFFILGKWWGVPILITHFIVLFFYVNLLLEINMKSIESFSTSTILNFMVETTIVATGICYLILQFNKTNKIAEVKLKNINLKLQNQNQEKEVMLKEIHHRVKNNLQVITSLLRLQSKDINDENHLDSFNEAINRVQAMALIHEKMYQSEILSDFDLKGYLLTLADDLIASYAVNKSIVVNVECNVSNVGTKSIVPVSLLFNELISNSIKHGFKNLDNGKIKVNVSVSKIDSAYFNLDYSDNGIWIGDTKKSFGLELISTMTEQLDGKYSLHHDKDGTFYSFALKALMQ